MITEKILDALELGVFCVSWCNTSDSDPDLNKVGLVLKPLLIKLGLSDIELPLGSLTQKAELINNLIYIFNNLDRNIEAKALRLGVLLAAFDSSDTSTMSKIKGFSIDIGFPVDLLDGLLSQIKESNGRGKGQIIVDCLDNLRINLKCPRIFLSHGHNDLLKYKLKNFITNHLKYNTIILSEQPNEGLTIVEKLEKASDECNFAIILMTKDDRTVDGGVRARQNVIHELGFFQGKYGRSRVILLYEKGLEPFTNISGIVRVEFDAEHFDAVFESLRTEFSRVV